MKPIGPIATQIASVVFPSGKTVSLGGKDADGKFVADDSNLCITCHQGRESTNSVNAALKGKEADTVDPKVSFKNIHYLAAGATLFGGDAMGAYQYADQQYVGQNTEHPLNKCKDCHDVHALEPKLEACAGCHGDTKPEDIRYNSDTTDWDGDGDVTEGVDGEIQTLSEALYAEIQAYASQELCWPSSMTAMPIRTSSWMRMAMARPIQVTTDPLLTMATGPRDLLKAAFNYQYSQKDPGAFVHNPKYVIQFLYDSIKDLGGDVSKLHSSGSSGSCSVIQVRPVGNKGDERAQQRPPSFKSYSDMCISDSPTN